MITKEHAVQFAREWVDAWNAHDLQLILSHYADDFEMSSPFIARVTGVETGTLKGKEAVGDYWAKALQKMPDLRFELIDVFTSVQSVCILYKSVMNLRAVEWLHFNSSGKVSKAMAHYDT